MCLAERKTSRRGRAAAVSYTHLVQTALHDLEQVLTGLAGTRLCLLEKQFHNAYLKAEAMPGKTGENLLQLMELRLDNVVFRLGLAQTRRDARQLVSHVHFTVNGKKVNIPSYLIKAGDVIEVRESSRSSAKFAKLTGPEAPVVALPSWLDREAGTLKGVVNKLPERSDIDYEVAEHLIVELYSK